MNVNETEGIFCFIVIIIIYLNKARFKLDPWIPCII